MPYLKETIDNMFKEWIEGSAPVSEEVLRDIVTSGTGVVKIMGDNVKYIKPSDMFKVEPPD